jgi:hypothetical protein
MTTTMTSTSTMTPPEPTLARTDFVGWQRETLEQLTLDLMTENTRLRADLRMVLDAHRAALVKTSPADAVEVVL